MSKVKPYKNSDLGKKDQVTKMFDTISKDYDGLNRVISFGIDVKWRKKVLQIVAESKPEIVLDIATGTADIALELSKIEGSTIIGLDISAGMLAVGEQKMIKNNYNSETSEFTLKKK